MSFSLRWWLGKPHADYYKPRIFHSNADMFDFCTEWGERFPVRKRPMVAFVVADITDSTVSGGTALFQEPPPANTRFYKLLVAAKPDFISTVSFAVGPGEGDLSQDDLVAWVPFKRHRVTGWQGAIVAKLRPALTEYGPAVECLY